MARALGWLKAAYNFISGDWIVLVIVLIAFAADYALLRALPDQQLAAGVIFVALIVLSLVVTLGRERATARRKQRGV